MCDAGREEGGAQAHVLAVFPTRRILCVPRLTVSLLSEWLALRPHTLGCLRILRVRSSCGGFCEPRASRAARAGDGEKARAVLRTLRIQRALSDDIREAALEDGRTRPALPPVVLTENRIRTQCGTHCSPSLRSDRSQRDNEERGGAPTGIDIELVELELPRQKA